MPLLIAKIRHDAFVKMKNCGHYIRRELSQIEHTKIWKKNNQFSQRYYQFSKNMLMS